jgi:hypothetical protein
VLKIKKKKKKKNPNKSTIFPFLYSSYEYEKHPPHLNFFLINNNNSVNWLSNIEIRTYSPLLYRPLCAGPQFIFKARNQGGKESELRIDIEASQMGSSKRYSGGSSHFERGSYFSTNSEIRDPNISQ